MKKETVDIIKQVVGSVVGIGVTVLCSVFAGNVADSSNGNKLSKALIKLGGAAIGGMVANEANKYISNEIDDVVETVESVKKLTENIRKETERTGEVNG